MQTDDNYKPSFSFEILQKDSKTKARLGRITTAHGIVETPMFTPVGTQATVKSVSPFELKEIGVQMLFGNTYHLHLRPGEEIVDEAGGLGKFMSWDGVTITDSGGFQVFSLGRGKKWNASGIVNENENIISESGSPSPKDLASEEEDILVKITDDQVTFRSHIDGSVHVFTPEKSIEIQHKLGADFILAFDQCPPNPATHDEAQKAVERTHEWLIRCLEYHKAHNTKGQAFVGIVQGSMYEDLRKLSAEFVGKQDVDAIAIGGVAVGETKEQMREALIYTMKYLPEEKYKHILGIGEVDDIFDVVAEGVDTFDCVIPTRFGRYGVVFASPPEGGRKNKFRIDLNKKKYERDFGPMTAGCACKVCAQYSRAYIHHLFKANELLAYRLASYHNVHFLINLTKKIREAIREDRFTEMREAWLSRNHSLSLTRK